MQATFHDRAGPVSRDVEFRMAIVAGWTGRDPAAVERHIGELEALGVRRPPSVPVFYRVAAARLTIRDSIEVSGGASSGEVEVVLLRTEGRLWVGVGSDHTDREVETYGVTVSKQMCDKPLAPEFWAVDDVEPHWDRLVLRAWIQDGAGSRVLYQEGAVAGMLAPADLLARWGLPLADGTAMFCGTLAARGGIRPASRFEYEIEDPVLGRAIAHGYDVVALPVAG